jgi:hypothetical protein
MNVFRYPALVLCNPIFSALLGCETCHHRGVTSRHDNFNAICRVLLGDDTIASSSMRMFFRHALNMVSGGCNASPPLSGTRECEAKMALQGGIWRFAKPSLRRQFAGETSQPEAWFPVNGLNQEIVPL